MMNIDCDVCHNETNLASDTLWREAFARPLIRVCDLVALRRSSWWVERTESSWWWLRSQSVLAQRFGSLLSFGFEFDMFVIVASCFEWNCAQWFRRPTIHVTRFSIHALCASVLFVSCVVCELLLRQRDMKSKHADRRLDLYSSIICAEKRKQWASVTVKVLQYRELLMRTSPLNHVQVLRWWSLW